MRRNGGLAGVTRWVLHVFADLCREWAAIRWTTGSPKTSSCVHLRAVFVTNIALQIFIFVLRKPLRRPLRVQEQAVRLLDVAQHAVKSTNEFVGQLFSIAMRWKDPIQNKRALDPMEWISESQGIKGNQIKGNQRESQGIKGNQRESNQNQTQSHSPSHTHTHTHTHLLTLTSHSLSHPITTHPSHPTPLHPISTAQPPTRTSL